MFLNINEVVPTIASIVEDLGPDHVGVSSGIGCVYFEDETPSCIVGHLLHRRGMSAQQMEYAGVNGESFDAAFIELGIRTSLEARVYLYILQQLQDKGVPWGECKRRADEFRLDFEGGVYANMDYMDITEWLELA